VDICGSYIHPRQDGINGLTFSIAIIVVRLKIVKRSMVSMSG
jgi:hypothetical protein